ncbi:MAG: NUDIX domain-containing protein [Anaerolineae bacterium]|nr:NUDIX domain-containing protein [Anaerolineae bacterium]
MIYEKKVFYEAAGGVVITPDHKQVLLLIRPAHDEIRLPKGHVDPGETPQQTALREVAEESGYGDLELLTDLGEQLVAFNYNGRAIQRTEHYYLMVIRSKTTTERPAADTEQFISVWASWEEAQQSLTFEAEKIWIERGKQALERIEL